jgi:A/G-specific adenine glycosylase
VDRTAPATVPPRGAAAPPSGVPDATLPTGARIAPLRRAVLAWYDGSGRTFPFRGVTDPWAILVSEAMAQQTQAARAGEAWASFIRAYPTPAALAAASPADVVRAWRGLGYNRRALALRAAAIAIVADHGGHVPDDIAALERLPGVGPYTARAVAALAFGRPVAAVDTNVRRVVGRLSGPSAAVSPPELQRLADALVDPVRPGDWTHALMDVGATVCRRARPDHAACPLEPWCRTAREPATGGEPVPAAAASRGARVAEERQAFPSTRRWLRGRVVDRLRDAPDGAWVRLEASIGDHDAGSVARALAGLERDGLLERHPDDPTRVRLPVHASPQGRAR